MRLKGLGMRLKGLGMRLKGLGMRLKGLGIRLKGLGLGEAPNLKTISANEKESQRTHHSTILFGDLGHESIHLSLQLYLTTLEPHHCHTSLKELLSGLRRTS